MLLLEEASAFEPLYTAARSREGRILSDEQVARLPDGSGLWNADEWRIRARSADRFLADLGRMGIHLRVLEVGCGNGWLSGAMHRNGHTVIGIDRSTRELEQAARVFPGPGFMRAGPSDPLLPGGIFDVVVFAASIQYFADPAATIANVFRLLHPGGAVHILDSVLYADRASATAADKRSRDYFKKLGATDLASYYHAHALPDLLSIGSAEVIARPLRTDRIKRLAGRSVSPFTHVVIRP